MAAYPRPDLEAELRPPVRRHLRAQGYEVRDEVRVNGRLADLVGVDDERVVAVELKLRDWRTAHAQARHYQLGAHEAHVALPHGKATRIATEWPRFEASGVGVLGVTWPDGDVRRLVPARRSDRFLPFLADALRRGRTGSRGRPRRRFR